MGRRQVVEIPFEPRPHQLEVYESLKRFNVIVCHRRFGKTVLAINLLVRSALENHGMNPRYAYIAPLYKQAKTVAWDYLKYYTDPIPGREYRESELKVMLPGGREIRLLGGDNPDALRGIYLDGVVLDEYAQMPITVWKEVVRPALVDRKGWALFLGTPKGKNPFFDMYQHGRKNPDRWFTAIYRASETGIVDAEELQEAYETMGPDEYAQEFECSFEAGIRGAYFAHLVEDLDKKGRINPNVGYDPNFPVHTWWDIGVDDATAIWFVQNKGGRLQFIDYYESSGEGLEHYLNVLKQRDYRYGDHIGPHDMSVTEFGSGRSRIETAANFGFRFDIAPKWHLTDGIHAVRTTLPMCEFNEVNCARGIEALRQYRKEYDPKTQMFREKPKRDWTTHGADAFRTGCQAMQHADEETPRQAVAESDFDPITV